MNKGIAVNARHIGIDLSDNQLGVFSRCLNDINTDAKADVAVLIRKRGLNQGYIHLYHAAVEQRWNLRKKYRAVICKPAIDGIAGVVSDKKRIVPEVALEFLVGIGGKTKGPDMHYFSVKKSLGIGVHIVNEGAHQILRLAAGSADKYPVTGMYVRKYATL